MKMTETEKNERIKAVEEQMAKLQKELEDIRKGVNSEWEATYKWDFSEWNDILKLATIHIFDDTKDQFINRVFKPRMSFAAELLKFKYCYDRDYIPHWNDTVEIKWSVAYNNTTKQYWVLKNTNIERCEAIYFSSEEIAQKCCDWLNAGRPEE